MNITTYRLRVAEKLLLWSSNYSSHRSIITCLLRLTHDWTWLYWVLPIPCLCVFVDACVLSYYILLLGCDKVTKGQIKQSVKHKLLVQAGCILISGRSTICFFSLQLCHLLENQSKAINLHSGCCREVPFGWNSSLVVFFPKMVFPERAREERGSHNFTWFSTPSWNQVKFQWMHLLVRFLVSNIFVCRYAQSPNADHWWPLYNHIRFRSKSWR